MLRRELVEKVKQVAEKYPEEQRDNISSATLTGFFNGRDAICEFMARQAVMLRSHPAPTRRIKGIQETLENTVEILSSFGNWVEDDKDGVIAGPEIEVGEPNNDNVETEGTITGTESSVSGS